MEKPLVTTPNVKDMFGKAAPLTANQEIRLDEVQNAFQDFAERLLELTYVQAGRQEFLEVLQQVKGLVDTNIRKGRHIVCPDVLSKLLFKIEEQDKLVKQVWLHCTDYAELRKFGRDILDIESRVEYLRKGRQASLWSTDIWINRMIPPGWCRLIEEGQEGEKPDHGTNSSAEFLASLTRIY